MRILVVSPVASHPQHQGNSARIHALCSGLQVLGHQLHFLYYPLEGLTAMQRSAMAGEWDAFHVADELPFKPEPDPERGYAIDDWYHPGLGARAAELHRLWAFDAVLVNYVWMSAVLDALPDDLVKIIDTHDLFGDRQLAFHRLGLRPEWFFTTAAEERRGLRRAHLVLAIQSLEALQLRERLTGTDVAVHILGHAIPARFLSPVASDRQPCVGYLGSGNPFNAAAIQRFARQLRSSPDLAAGFRFLMGGSVCAAVGSTGAPFELLGIIQDAQDFYTRVDIVVNPMPGGTGLKIKTLEGLSFGLPVLGTTDAWAGICEPAEVWPDAGSQAPAPFEALSALAVKPEWLGPVRQRCREAFIAYLSDQIRNLQAVFGPGGQVHLQSMALRQRSQSKSL